MSLGYYTKTDIQISALKHGRETNTIHTTYNLNNHANNSELQ